MATKSKPKDSASTNVSRDELKAMISEELRTAKGKRKADLIRQYTKLQRWGDKSISMKPHSRRKSRAKEAQDQHAEQAREMLEKAHAELKRHFPEITSQFSSETWEPNLVLEVLYQAGRDWAKELDEHGLRDREYFFVVWQWALRGLRRADGGFITHHDIRIEGGCYVVSNGGAPASK